MPFQTSTRSPTPLTQVEETNENEDEIQVTIEPPPAQVSPGEILELKLREIIHLFICTLCIVQT